MGVELSLRMVNTNDSQFKLLKLNDIFIVAGLSAIKQKQWNLQNRGANKYILNDYNLRYTNRLMKRRLLPVSCWHEQKDLCTLHKLLNNAYDIKTFTYVSPKLVKSRSSSGLILQPHFSRTLSFKNSYFNRVTSSWNALPEPIRTAKTFRWQSIYVA